VTVSLVCPICRRVGGDGVRRAWPLRRKRKTLACSNPACDGRFVTEPFPILHKNPGAAFERMVHVPTGLPLEALGMMLRSLPEGSALRRSFEHQSRDLWRHYHDLLPEGYRPGFVHPAPFSLRALSILDTVQLPVGVRALIVGSGPGRAALELAQRLNKLAESQTLPEGGDATLAHFYPELFALDLDPMQLIAMRLLGKQPLEVLLRGSSEGWHSPERLELPAALRKNADLIQPVCGDALDPPFEGESFDLIVCLNLLERVSAPLRLLSELQRLLRPGGHLLLSSAFSWRAEVTPPAARLAAVVPHARRPDVELLQEILAGRLTTGEHFDLYSVAVMQPTPAFTRHYDTELSAELAHVSLWKRPAKGSVLSTGAYRAVRDEPSK
jgi:SAM-dependent methyltransferase